MDQNILPLRSATVGVGCILSFYWQQPPCGTIGGGVWSSIGKTSMETLARKHKTNSTSKQARLAQGKKNTFQIHLIKEKSDEKSPTYE